METLVQANIFFFITSLSVIAVSFFVILLVLKLRKLVGSLHLLVDKLKNTSDYVGEEAKDLVEDIKQSPVFRLLFPRRKKRSSSESEKTSSSKTRRKV
ncbi:MAG: hypothetical protein QG654_269 [Patescibacteria group bacterium]|nr:hypothetical protein [Patescibacteria group bacterium]